MGNPVIRFEIGCRDKTRTTDFYERVFDWKSAAGEFATEIETGAGKGVDKGIDGAITALGHEPHNYVMVYMEVADINAACEKVVAHGGKVTIGPVDIPGGKGRFAWFNDPEGNLLGLFQPPA